MAQRRRVFARQPVTARTTPLPAPELSLWHPAPQITMTIAAACIVLSVTFRLAAVDLWHHLLVGRAIWERGIPREHLWSWASYGRPEALPSWLFQWSVWPFHEAWGVEGLFVWRWIATLAAFGFAWATARRLGARGLTTLVVLTWCALAYRTSAELRPEALAVVLLAATVFLLERARRGGKGGLPWLVPILGIWVNTHVSWVLGFALLAIHSVPALLARPGVRAPIPLGRLAAIAGIALVVALAGPFGWRQLTEPLGHALRLTGEPLFRTVAEMQPVTLSTGWRYGLWVLVLGWPLLFIGRTARHGWDWAEALTLVVITAYGLGMERNLGFFAVVAAPYLARDVQTGVHSWRWPRWLTSSVARAMLASAACVVVCIPEWLDRARPPGVAVAMERYPVGAADFMERHRIQGRGFADLRSAGYQAWEFWPERSRLPFMDVQGSGTAQDRAAYAAAFLEPSTWPGLARRHRFDYAVLDRRQPSSAALVNAIDSDTAWVMVFFDDAAALYVRRDAHAELADRLGFRWLGGGTSRVRSAVRTAASDLEVRPILRAELMRAMGESRWNATAAATLADLDLVENRTVEAKRHLDMALSLQPNLPGGHQRLGVIALYEGRVNDAIVEFERERARNPDTPGIDLGLGMAYQRAGDLVQARRYYEHAVANDPGNAEARARLDSLGAGRR